MAIADRLKMIMRKAGHTNSSFADYIEIQRSSVSHVLTGRNKPSIDFIEKILRKFPEVDPVWLITGEKQIERVETEVKQTREVMPQKTIISPVRPKRITRIVVYYDDNSYVETQPVSTDTSTAQ
ncbi:MAG: helix-turn-helix domain-containing protein [Brumimicrobium sp.]|nr:helix-turn-helix domain-containing protein [Brumimicrobium sp.]